MVEDVINVAAEFEPVPKNKILVAKGNKVDPNTGSTYRYIELKEDEANHFVLLGLSGFRKTTTMKAILQEVYLKTRWGRNREKPLIVIFEAKYDRAKAQNVKQVFYKLLREKGDSWVVAHYPQYKELKLYISLLSNPGLAGKVGLMGDFALGWGNILGLQKIDSRNTELSNFGLQPMPFPVRRFVFNPSRALNHIALDSGAAAEVVATFLRYDRLNFYDLIKLLNLNPATIYATIIKEAWDNLGLRDPDDVIVRAKEIYNEMLEFLEIESKRPNISLWGVKANMERLKSNPLFRGSRLERVKVKDLLDLIDNDKINIIDFSQNSSLTDDEKKLVFRKVIEYLRDEYPHKKETAIFIAGDEIQRYIDDKAGKKVMSSLFREGRSNQINFLAATQYLHSLPHELVYGATHILILGTLASVDDYNILKRLVADFDVKFNRVVASSPSEVERLRAAFKGRGYLVTNKFFTERVLFRPSQSL